MSNHKGIVQSINISREKGTVKEPVMVAKFLKDHGIEGDAHAGNWHRQISLLADASIEKMRVKGLPDLKSGDFAENLTLSDFDLLSCKVGDQLRVGEQVLLEVTQIGKSCHGGCEILKKTGDCVMPREGYFARVLESGSVSVGDEVLVEKGIQTL